MNYDLARQLATSQVPASHPASVRRRRQRSQEAVRLAELWLDGATSFPTGRPHRDRLDPPAVDRRDHADVGEALLPHRRAGVRGLDRGPARAGARPRPARMLAMMGSMGGMAFG